MVVVAVSERMIVFYITKPKEDLLLVDSPPLIQIHCAFVALQPFRTIVRAWSRHVVDWRFWGCNYIANYTKYRLSFEAIKFWIGIKLIEFADLNAALLSVDLLRAPFSFCVLAKINWWAWIKLKILVKQHNVWFESLMHAIKWLIFYRFLRKFCIKNF